jgi:hypothetical protein
MREGYLLFYDSAFNYELSANGAKQKRQMFSGAYVWDIIIGLAFAND